MRVSEDERRGGGCRIGRRDAGGAGEGRRDAGDGTGIDLVAGGRSKASFGGG